MWRRAGGLAFYLGAEPFGMSKRKGFLRKVSGLP